MASIFYVSTYCAKMTVMVQMFALLMLLPLDVNHLSNSRILCGASVLGGRDQVQESVHRVIKDTGGVQSGTDSKTPNPTKEISNSSNNILLTTKKPDVEPTDVSNSKSNDTLGGENVKCNNGTEICPKTSNEGSSGGLSSITAAITDNSGMLFRAMYVLLGVTGIVVLYFVIRAVRLRTKRSKSRKYGIITQHDNGGMEMEPLGDGDDDDDDYTVFEMNGRNGRKK